MSRVRGMGCSYLEDTGTSFAISQQVASCSSQLPTAKQETEAQESEGAFPQLPECLAGRACPGHWLSGQGILSSKDSGES